VLDALTPERVAAALARLYGDAALRDRMGEAGRGLVEQSPSARCQGVEVVSECIREVARGSCR